MQLPTCCPLQSNLTLDSLLDRADALNIDQFLPDPTPPDPAIYQGPLGANAFRQVRSNAYAEITMMATRKNIEIVVTHGLIMAHSNRT